VDIVVKGRHTEITERFRRHSAEKLAKVEHLDPKVIRIDVEVCREHNPRLADRCVRIELTCRSKGPVIRAEAAADDPYAALDLAWGKLEARLRRAADRRRVHHGGKSPVSVASALAPSVSDRASTASEQAGSAGLIASSAGERMSSSLNGNAPSTALRMDLPTREPDRTRPVAQGEDAHGDRWAVAEPEGPMVIREKVHEAVPMSLDQALYEMELVGHDFYLFVDSVTARPSVVYRRRAYDYGVIRLEM
jgi:ribosomal subunit interface protein